MKKEAQQNKIYPKMQETIEKIKRDGAINSLTAAIGDRIFQITHNNFNNIKNNNGFTRLEEAITEARYLLEEIEVLLEVLNDIKQPPIED